MAAVTLPFNVIVVFVLLPDHHHVGSVPFSATFAMDELVQIFELRPWKRHFSFGLRRPREAHAVRQRHPVIRSLQSSQLVVSSCSDDRQPVQYRQPQLASDTSERSSSMVPHLLRREH